MLIGFLILILFFSIVLIKSCDLVIVAVRRLSRETHTPSFFISAIILALGTSFPELSVGITSALEKSPSLTLGVIIGSNIANIALIAGVAGFISGRVNVYGNFLKKDVLIAFAAGLLPIALALDGSLNAVDGLILISIYLAYTLSFFRQRFQQIGEEQRNQSGFVIRFVRKFEHIDSKRTKELGRFFVGLAVMLFSADVLVKLSEHIAQLANIPLFLVGLFFIAVGTSLPELAFSLRSLEDHEPSMFFGNILGSIIVNSTLIIGVTALIAQISVFDKLLYFKSAIAFMVVFAVFWFFVKSKNKLERWESGILIITYIFFLISEIV